MSTEFAYIATATSGGAGWNSTVNQGSQDLANIIRYWYPGIIVWIYIPFVVGIPGNTLVLLAYAKNYSLRTPTNLLIVNQSVADLVVYAIGLCFVWFNYTLWGLNVASTHKYVCLYMLCSINVGLLSSVVNLLALTVERFLAVAFPYQYLRWVTDASVKRVILVLWTMMMVIANLPILGWNTWTPGKQCTSVYMTPNLYFVNLFLLQALLVLVIMAILNIIICGIAFIVRRKVAPHPSTLTKKEGEQAPRGDYKITRMFLMVVGVFYLSWFPFTVMTIMFLTTPEYFKTHGISEWTLVVHEMSKGLLVYNAAVNPYIYYKTNAGFRDAFRKLLKLKGSQG